MAAKYSMKVYRYISFQRFCELLFHQELALVHPSKWPDQYETSVIARYSFIILILLVFTGILGLIVRPISGLIINFLNIIVSLIV